MSQTENAVTSSSGAKRAYRKGKPLSEAAVIDYAASLVNKNRTDFIIELAYQEAKNIILDQRLFVLDNEGYDSFITQLEAPVQNAEGRERLMAVKPEWK